MLQDFFQKIEKEEHLPIQFRHYADTKIRQVQ